MERIQSSSKTTYRSDVDVKSTPRSEPPTRHSRRTDGEDQPKECTTVHIPMVERSIPPNSGSDLGPASSDEALPCRAVQIEVMDHFIITNDKHAKARHDQIARAFEEAARLVGVKVTKVSPSVA